VGKFSIENAVKENQKSEKPFDKPENRTVFEKTNQVFYIDGFH
jgi:hypothetical protein